MLDEEQFQELALREIDAVYRFARHLQRRSDEVLDLVQETYLQALASRRNFVLGERGIRPWLFQILYNLHRRRLSRIIRDPRASDLLDETVLIEPASGEAPCWDLQSLNWEQVDDRLKRAIDQLPETQRAVLLLWAVEGMKYREIAEALSIAEGTVMSRLYRARSFLSEQLADLAAENGINTERTTSHAGGKA